MQQIDPMIRDRGLLVEMIPCGTFGGGWAIPKNDPSREFLREFFDDDAAPLAPLEGVEGYIVEPRDWAECLAMLADAGAVIL